MVPSKQVTIGGSLYDPFPPQSQTIAGCAARATETTDNKPTSRVEWDNPCRRRIQREFDLLRARPATAARHVAVSLSTGTTSCAFAPVAKEAVASRPSSHCSREGTNNSTVINAVPITSTFFCLDDNEHPRGIALKAEEAETLPVRENTTLKTKHRRSQTNIRSLEDPPEHREESGQEDKNGTINPSSIPPERALPGRREANVPGITTWQNTPREATHILQTSIGHARGGVSGFLPGDLVPAVARNRTSRQSEIPAQPQMREYHIDTGCLDDLSSSLPQSSPLDRKGEITGGQQLDRIAFFRDREPIRGTHYVGVPDMGLPEGSQYGPGRTGDRHTDGLQVGEALSHVERCTFDKPQNSFAALSDLDPAVNISHFRSACTHTGFTEYLVDKSVQYYDIGDCASAVYAKDIGGENEQLQRGTDNEDGSDDHYNEGDSSSSDEMFLPLCSQRGKTPTTQRRLQRSSPSDWVPTQRADYSVVPARHALHSPTVANCHNGARLPVDTCTEPPLNSQPRSSISVQPPISTLPSQPHGCELTQQRGKRLGMTGFPPVSYDAKKPFKPVRFINGLANRTKEEVVYASAFASTLTQRNIVISGKTDVSGAEIPPTRISETSAQSATSVFNEELRE